MVNIGVSRLTLEQAFEGRAPKAKTKNVCVCERLTCSTRARLKHIVMIESTLLLYLCDDSIFVGVIMGRVFC